MSFGNFPVSLSDIRVAALPSTGVYGTAVAMPGITMKIKPNVSSDKLAKLGKTARVATHVIDCDVEFDVGGYPFDVMAIVAGAAATTSGTTPDQKTSAPLAAGSLLPKFGIVGKSIAEDGGDLHWGLPEIKLTEFPNYSMDGENNTFVKGTMKGLAIADGDGYIIYPLAHETAAAIDFTEIFA